jgi:hypothetical protein
MPDSQNKRYSKNLKNRLKSYLRHPGDQDMAWDYRYFVGRENDTWYGKLFESARTQGLISGEITPAYSILPENRVRHIVGLNSDIKIVFIMRDPVERSWSQVVKYHKKIRDGDLAGLTTEDCLAFLDREGCRARSDYLEIIDNWGKHVPESNMFIGFYDQLEESPETLVRNLLNFLCVDPDAYPAWDAVGKTRYSAASYGYPIPTPVRDFLVQRYSTQVHALQKYGHYPQRWLSRYQSL